MILALARVMPTQAQLMRAWLAACAATVVSALVVTAMSERGPSVATVEAASTAPATAPAVTAVITSVEEPWVPGVMTFSSEPAPRTAPISVDELDPNCFCIGFF